MAFLISQVCDGHMMAFSTLGKIDGIGDSRMFGTKRNDTQAV